MKDILIDGKEGGDDWEGKKNKRNEERRFYNIKMG